MIEVMFACRTAKGRLRLGFRQFADDADDERIINELKEEYRTLTIVSRVISGEIEDWDKRLLTGLRDD